METLLDTRMATQVPLFNDFLQLCGSPERTYTNSRVKTLQPSSGESSSSVERQN